MLRSKAVVRGLELDRTANIARNQRRYNALLTSAERPQAETFMEKTPEDAISTVRPFYAALPGRIAQARVRAARPLTLAEKILYTHLDASFTAEPVRGETTAALNPDAPMEKREQRLNQVITQVLAKFPPTTK